MKTENIKEACVKIGNDANDSNCCKSPKDECCGSEKRDKEESLSEGCCSSNGGSVSRCCE